MQLKLDLAARLGNFRLAARADLDLSSGSSLPSVAPRDDPPPRPDGGLGRQGPGVVALFGPSGAGKSTILSAIAGFRPGTGKIEFDGELWQDARQMIPAHRRPVGMVFQDGRLFSHLSVAGNLGYAERRADRGGTPIAEAAVIEALDLADLRARRPDTLSGGERQRVAMARALLTRPRLMLMDEPLAALDRARKAELLPMIADLPRRFGVPVIYVSHQLDEIVQIADSLVAIRDGRILGQGAVAEMIETMDPVLTGRFEAGSVLQGPVSALEPKFSMAAIEIGGARLWMPDVGGAAMGELVRVRIRARDVSLAREALTGISIRNQLPCIVTGIETDEGAFAEVRLDCAGQSLRARISRMALSDLELKPGNSVWALIKSISFDRRLNRG